MFCAPTVGRQVDWFYNPRCFLFYKAFPYLSPYPSMLRAYQRIAVIGKRDSTEADQVLGQAVQVLSDAGVEVFLEEDTAKRLQLTQCTPLPWAELPTKAQLFLVVGGDGTLLHAAHLAVPHGLPLTGVNLGRLGFLADIGVKQMVREIDDLLSGRFVSEPRAMLDMTLYRGEDPQGQGTALNDVAVIKSDQGRVIALEVEVDQYHAYALQADGMLVATPTGSTAYALAANGPIVMPTLGVLALVPLYPHVLSCRPLVIPDSAKVELTLRSLHHGMVYCDGRFQGQLAPGDRLCVQRSRYQAQILHPPGYDYFNMLRTKLRWG